MISPSRMKELATEKYIEKSLSENKQKLVMFQLTGFLETLKYLKSETTDEFIFNCYIKALKIQISKDLEELLNE